MCIRDRRGIDKLERTEIWCPSRTIAVKLQNELLGRSTKKEGHISIGQNFSDRRKKENLKFIKLKSLHQN